MAQGVRHVARADFRERVRTCSFLVTLAGAVGFGWLVHTGNLALSIGGYRGVFNSAWLGTLLGVVIASFLSLAGFYLAKNALERDRRTGVGELLAATPLSKLQYVGGKALSNFLLLGTIVGLLAATGIGIQLLNGEERRIDLAAYLLPLLCLALPPAAVTAALAVLFESVRWLRGTLGNVVYFFLWSTLLTLSAVTESFDYAGLHLLESELSRATASYVPGGAHGMSLTLGPQQALHSFPWDGIAWTGERITGRLAGLGWALGITLLAALLFARFDPARERQKPPKPAASPSQARRRLAFLRFQPRSPFLALVLAEIRLMLYGRSVWWFWVAAGLIAAGLLAPASRVRAVALPLAWLWPLPLWSELGSREKLSGTAELVFSGPHPAWFGAAAIATAGWLVTAAAGSGVLLRLTLTGDGAGLLGWIVGSLFIPVFALALGVWTGNGRAFEILYLLLWYLGPINHAPVLDYLGATPQSLALGVPWVFLALTSGLLVAALAGRRRMAAG